LKQFKYVLIGFAATYVAFLTIYFIFMYQNGYQDISTNSQDWAAVGGFVGGFLAPMATLLAGYFVYLGFASNAYEHKLKLARDSLERLDGELEKSLKQPFNNRCLGEQYQGMPLEKVIIDLSNELIEPNDKALTLLLARLHNIAILTDSIRYYVGLLKEVPSKNKDTKWLGELELGYWIEKYWPISRRMLLIVGTERFERKVSERQAKSFYFILGSIEGNE